MKKETKKVIPLIALLFVVDALFCGLIFYYQSKSIEKESKETRQKQIATLTELSSEALAGGDFFFLNTIIEQFSQHVEVVRTFIISQSEHRIIASIHEEDYGKVFNKENLVLTSPPSTELFRSPIDYKGKQWAELVVIYNKTLINNKKTALMTWLIITGGFIFFIGTMLVLGARRVTARSFTQVQKTSQRQGIDVFNVPELKHSTVIAVHNPVDSDMAEDALSPQEQRIMHIIFPHKTVYDILKDSPLDELVTFEIISRLLTYEKVHILRGEG